jgi:hypothetical protein
VHDSLTGARLMDYEYLSAAVGEAGSAGHRPASMAARAAVREWVIAVLRGVADGTRPVRAVTHPLGFTCLPVERAGRDGVCVHLWSPRVDRVAPTTSAIHSHCWELTSYALFGQLENRVIGVADVEPGSQSRDDQPWDDWAPGACRVYRVLEVRSGADVDELVPTQRHVRCLPGQAQAIAAGDVYSVPAGVFHVTEVHPDTEAATVALGRLVPGVPDRSLGLPSVGPHQVWRRRCDAEQTSRAARVVMDRLLAATACPA